MNGPRKPGLDTFWESADSADSAQDPLERELDERVDALRRYQSLIVEAEENGKDDAAEILLKQHAREAQAVRRLREELNRRNGGAHQGPSA